MPVLTAVRLTECLRPVVRLGQPPPLVDQDHTADSLVSTDKHGNCPSCSGKTGRDSSRKDFSSCGLVFRIRILTPIHVSSAHKGTAVRIGGI